MAGSTGSRLTDALRRSAPLRAAVRHRRAQALLPDWTSLGITRPENGDGRRVLRGDVLKALGALARDDELRPACPARHVDWRTPWAVFL